MLRVSPPRDRLRLCWMGRSKWALYAVAKGKYLDSPGIYTTWAETSYHVTGCSGAVHCGHKTRAQAELWLEQNREDCGGASASLSAPETCRRARDMAANAPSSSSASCSSLRAQPRVSVTLAPARGDPIVPLFFFVCTTPAVDREYLDPQFYDRRTVTPLGQHEPRVKYYRVPEPWCTAKKFYAVARGHTPGVYTAYDGPYGALMQVQGFPKNDYKKCSSEQQAWDHIHDYHEKRKLRNALRKSMLVGGVRDDWDDWEEALLNAAARHLAAQMSPSSSRASSPAPFALDVDVHVAGAYAVDSRRAGIGLFFGVEDWHNSSERCPSEWETPERAEIFAVIRALQAAPLCAGSLVIRTASFDSIVSLAYCNGNERAYINKRLALCRRYEQTVRIVSGFQADSPAIAFAHHGTKMPEREDVDWAAKLAGPAVLIHDDEPDGDELEAVLRASLAADDPDTQPDAVLSTDWANAHDGSPVDPSGIDVARPVLDAATYARSAETRTLAVESAACTGAQLDAPDADMSDACTVPYVVVDSTCDAVSSLRASARPGDASGSGPTEPGVIRPDVSGVDVEGVRRPAPAPDPPPAFCPVDASDDEFPDDDSSWMDDAPADWLDECDRRPRCSTPERPLGPEPDDAVAPAAAEEFDDWTDALPVGLLSQFAAAAEPQAPCPAPHNGFDDDLDCASAWIDGISSSQLDSLDVPATSSPAGSMDDDSDWIDELSVEELDRLDSGHV